MVGKSDEGWGVKLGWCVRGCVNFELFCLYYTVQTTEIPPSEVHQNYEGESTS